MAGTRYSLRQLQRPLKYINTDRKELKQVLHFRFSFEPIFSEVDKSLFLAPPLRTTSCNVHYSGPILYDDERETWSKSTKPCTNPLSQLHEILFIHGCTFHLSYPYWITSLYENTTSSITVTVHKLT
jgi:hypothetical protein